MIVAGVRVRGAAVVYVLLEDILLFAALAGAFLFASTGLPPGTPEALFVGQVFALLLAVKTVFYYCGLYDFARAVTRRVFWRRLATALVIVAGASLLLGCGLADDPIACAAFLLALAAVVPVGRLSFELFVRLSGPRHRLLFLGVGRRARRTAREVLDDRNRDCEVVGFLAEQPDERGWRIGGKPVLGLYSDLERVVDEQRIDQVVVAVEDRRRQLPLEGLLRVRLGGVEVLDEARIHEEIAGKIPVEDLRPSWLIFSDGFANTRLRTVTKRLVDVVVAALGLLLSAPVSLLTAVAIRLDSRGPILYRQTRVGEGGREFVLYKFRSMRVDAERGGPPVWAQDGDPRVTRVGRILRTTRIDEIPQMWNVLQGTMSFVGPRPERPYFVERLRRAIPLYDQRHAVKPGVTGWAQVRFRYGSDETDAVEKLRHDMFYIKHHSILLDLRILLATVSVVFRRDMGR